MATDPQKEVRQTQVYQGGDVQNEPYNEQNHESVPDYTTMTMKEGEIAPMVLSDSKKQKTQHNMPAVNENIDRGDVNDKTYRVNGNYTKNVLMSAIHYQIRHHRPSADAQDLYKDEEIAFAMEGEEGHN